MVTRVELSEAASARPAMNDLLARVRMKTS
jgi:hypothetical protein